MTLDEMWDKLEDGYFTHDELQLCTDMDGYSEETLNKMIYCRYGVRTIEDLVEDHR